MSQSLMLDRISEHPSKALILDTCQRLKSFKDPILFKVTVKLIEGAYPSRSSSKRFFPSSFVTARYMTRVIAG
jgi:hypothetical protein